ncbi:MAG: hypothetical protein HeimC3_16700 [Candidatus Heimdallarchaeota archaeon LC_3]|nr:MAG: hypothetical protein HeimC3_16700 [Candidatus Heimdallarchaeota archaeon LC_3]
MISTVKKKTLFFLIIFLSINISSLITLANEFRYNTQSEDIFSAVESNAVHKYGSGVKWALWWGIANSPPMDNLSLSFNIQKFPSYDTPFHTFIEIRTSQYHLINDQIHVIKLIQ